MVVIEVTWMVGKDAVGCERSDLRLEKLNQLDVRHGVKANIREIAKYGLGEPYSPASIYDVSGEFGIARPLRSCIDMTAQKHGLNRFAPGCELGSGRTEAENFIVWMRRDDEVDCRLHRADRSLNAPIERSGA
ncbi:hypothetical protein A6F68_00395 [Tsuneonella dongtanensis]|uniref:Uncharacterized protein n=1 Tax=Tsuneonella dongtanensis TaxID=692370 RepID=A0A1B2A9U3_9SPHN|nr:hypothetical protein A6F68_00395 [Tsuneonella dongtanensis]